MRSMEERVSVLEAGYIEHTEDIRRLDRKVEAANGRLEGKLDNVIDRMAGRPPWPVSHAISVLASTCTALLVALIYTM